MNRYHVVITELRGDFLQRKTDKDIIKENHWLIILSTLLILFGVICAILPYIAPHVDYDSLQTKEVTIIEFKHFYGGSKGASYDYIRTTDGQKLILSGEYQREQLKELLTEGISATVKWYKNEPFWTLLVEEMYVDGERIVTYDNDKPVDWKSPLIFGFCSITLGIGGFFVLRLFVKTNRKKQKKRDERIRRKYGNVSK